MAEELEAAEASTGNVVTDVAALLSRRDSFPRELVYVPEWEASVWVWAYDVAADQRRAEFIRSGDEEIDRWELQTRSLVSRVIEAVRSASDVVDGKLPPPMFSYLGHADWLRAQPLAVLNQIGEVSERLNRETLATREQLQAFFATVPGLARCLARTASACGSCTDCPQSSQASCPLQLCKRLSLPTL